MLRFLLILLIISWSNLHAQKLSDPTRSSYEINNFSDVAGNPYLFKDWSEGVIRFTNGRVMKQFKLKFDCAQNRLLLQFEGTSFGAEGKVLEFVMYQKNGRRLDSVLFRKGFPAEGKATAETFYQVLVDLKVKLLKLHIKNIIEQKQLTGGSQYRHYQDEEKYFILDNEKIVEVKKDKASISEVLSDKAEDLKKFIEVEQIKLRSDEELIRVVIKYNELKGS